MSFSDRQGYNQEPEITVREDAPEDVRGLVADYAYEAGLDPHKLRAITCRVLLTRPNPENWSAYPNVDFEARGHLDSCPWFKVYDIIEAIYADLEKDKFGKDDLDNFDLPYDLFESRINHLLRAKGVGWQLKGGRVEARGPESFEKVVKDAGEELQKTGRTTAASELHEALKDLSRRPVPDLTGAIAHGMSALECTFRDVVGDKGTLGQLLSRYKDRFPAPLDTALEKLWGFASEYGRHVSEGKTAEYRDALLVVQIAAACSQYLITAAEKK